MYRADVYFLSKTLAEAPVFATIPLVFTTMAYYMIGLNPSPERFFIASGLAALITNVATSFGKFISFGIYFYPYYDNLCFVAIDKWTRLYTIFKFLAMIDWLGTQAYYYIQMGSDSKPKTKILFTRFSPLFLVESHWNFLPGNFKFFGLFPFFVYVSYVVNADTTDFNIKTFYKI